MVECTKCVDPTAMGLFLVAVVSLPLAINLLLEKPLPSSEFFEAIGIMIIIVALIAYKSNSNFGFTVFGLVGTAVALTGFGMGTSGWEQISFAVVFVLAIIWSIIAKTPKLLSMICLTTSLIFLFVGLGVVVGGSYWATLAGIAALGNFILNIYLSFALALETKLPVV